MSSDLAKRLGGWTQDATVQRYDHADMTEEIRRALESTSSSSGGGDYRKPQGTQKTHKAAPKNF